MTNESRSVLTHESTIWRCAGPVKAGCLAVVLALAIGAAAKAQGPHQQPPPPPPPPPPAEPPMPPTPWNGDGSAADADRQGYAEEGPAGCWTQVESAGCLRLKLDLSANRNRLSPHDATAFAQRLREIDRLEAELRDKLGELNRQIPDPDAGPY